MKRLSALLLTLLFSISPGLAQIGGGLFGTRNPGGVITVCKSGACDSTVICGMTIGGPAGSDCLEGSSGRNCLPGSAYSIAQTQVQSGIPTIIKISPGTYNECIAITNSNITLLGSGIDQTIIRVSDSSTGEKQLSGVLRVLSETSGSPSSNIEISNLTIQSDYITDSTAALHLGTKSCSNIDPEWDNIFIHDVKIIGANTSLAYCSNKDNLTGKIISNLTLRDSEIIGGREGILSRGTPKASIRGVHISIQSNYCEPPDSLDPFYTQRVGVAGTIQGFPVNQILLQPAEVPPVGSVFTYAQRILNLSDTTGGTTCTSFFDEKTHNPYTIIAWDPTTRIATVTPNSNGGFDNTCTYTISAATTLQAKDVPCRDIDWTMRSKDVAATLFRPSAKFMGYHADFGPGANTGAQSVTVLTDSQIDILVNDRTVNIDSGTFCPPTAGIAEAASTSLRNSFFNADINITINASATVNTSCAGQVRTAGVVAFGLNDLNKSSNFTYTGNIRVDNTADQNLDTAGIALRVAGVQEARSVVIPSAFISVKNSVVGYTGTTATISQVGSLASKLFVGDIYSDDAVTTIGVIDHISEIGAGFTASAVLDFVSAPINTCSPDLTIPVTGAALGDIIRLSVPAAAMVAGSQFNAWVGAADTVNIRHCCIDTATACDPASGTFTARVETP